MMSLYNYSKTVWHWLGGGMNESVPRCRTAVTHLALAIRIYNGVAASIAWLTRGPPFIVEAPNE